MGDPQAFLDEFLTCSVEGLPNVVSLVMGLLNSGRASPKRNDFEVGSRGEKEASRWEISQ
jgi:hypothetical protein